MKNLIFAICLLAVVGCSKKDVLPIDTSANDFLLYQIYSGDESALTVGLQFTSKTEVTWLIATPRRRTTLSATVPYTGVYPNLIIGGDKATFSDKEHLTINGMSLHKWTY